MLNRIPDKFFLSLFIAMNFLGVIGYYFGLDFYKLPSQSALNWIFIYGVSFVLAWLYFLFFYQIIFKPKASKVVDLRWSKKNYYLSDLGFFASVVLVVVYVYYFKNGFIFFQLISGAGVGDRPDVVGNIPFYWSFSVILSSFAIPLLLNAIYSFGLKKLKKYLLISLLAFFSLLLGDKSTMLAILFFVYFFLNRFSFSRVLAFVLIFIVFYILMKLVFHYSYGLEHFLDIALISESIFRRVSMINVSSMGVVLDDFAIAGGSLDNSYANIKQYVFYRIYGYLPGGAPVSFIVNDFYNLPLYLVPILIFGFTFFILFFRALALMKSPSYVLIAVMYLHFYGAIVLVSGGLFDYFFRSFAPTLILLFSSKVVLKRY